MLKAKIAMLVLACALGGSAFAGPRGGPIIHGGGPGGPIIPAPQSAPGMPSVVAMWLSSIFH